MVHSTYKSFFQCIDFFFSIEPTDKQYYELLEGVQHMISCDYRLCCILNTELPWFYYVFSCDIINGPQCM